MRFPEADITTIDLLRHGEPVGGRMLRGATDHPLSDKGWQQVTEAVMRQATNGRPPYDAIITSPLSRCREFALWLGEEFDLPVQIEDDLAELNLGRWEGKTHSQVFAEEGTAPMSAFWNSPATMSPPEGETMAAFDCRLAEVWRDLLANPPGRHVLVVAHLFVCNGLLRQVLEQPLDRVLAMDLPYAAMSRVRHERHALGETSFIEWIGR
ncbi:alpha-ribazole phosphatase/probable phosphoglycerate mutase [Vreelandella songnenensis]|uniref:Alpha-ribazole phosphatase/probable phosphoglycerate mutase n=1 Tax=Vreelandella songnenensis TaxID=1176243 RepID=A0A2T0V2M7_9GAMM|nr:histidine phosphatase family protein [Halomonas songnenensis]PRY64414.1 alpha-ribazole phosphatase/probable phosphoglycerate mutase [Halomonas songnenensis]